MVENYRSAVVGGLGKNLGNWGALSFDMSYSDTYLVNGDDKQGDRRLPLFDFRLLQFY